jgi:hypothetical protein
MYLGVATSIGRVIFLLRIGGFSASAAKPPIPQNNSARAIIVIIVRFIVRFLVRFII